MRGDHSSESHMNLVGLCCDGPSRISRGVAAGGPSVVPTVLLDDRVKIVAPSSRRLSSVDDGQCKS